MDSDVVASLTVFAALVGVLIAILWLLLPFAVFGIKGKIDELLDIERKQLENLRLMRRKLVPEFDDVTGKMRPDPANPPDELSDS
jgi:hypothetical protein